MSELRAVLRSRGGAQVIVRTASDPREDVFDRSRTVDVATGIAYRELPIASVLKHYAGDWCSPIAEDDPAAIRAVELVRLVLAREARTRARAHGDAGALNRDGAIKSPQGQGVRR